MKTKANNQLYLYLFCALIGITAGAVIWAFLKVMTVGTALLWEEIPQRLELPCYTVLACTAGGLIIGVFRKFTGDYPEELETVFGKFKKNKTYEYRNMPVLLLAALLPLLVGSSVGPEAGMTGIIVGLCCWAGDNIRFAKNHAKEYSQIGMAVTLSVLFRAPLFGVFAVEEENEDATIGQITRSAKLLVYGIAIAAGTGVFALLSVLFGSAMEGLPAFSAAEVTAYDYPAMIGYVLCGSVLAWFYNLTHRWTMGVSVRVPAVLREVLAGLCLGLIGTFVPLVMFSGEEQMGMLMSDYTEYLPVFLIGIAFLKVLLTNICIHFGLKGGHFFPVIFAGVSMGYGMSSLLFAQGGDHVIIAAAVVTASLLGGIMKKPVAVAMLLLLCFPVRMIVWIFLAAVIGSRIFSGKDGEEKK